MPNGKVCQEGMGKTKRICLPRISDLQIARPIL